MTDTEQYGGKKESEKITKLNENKEKLNKDFEGLKTEINLKKRQVEKKILNVDNLYTYFKDTYFYREVNKEKEKIKNDTKLEIIGLFSEYGSRDVNSQGKTYIPSQFESEYLQLKSYIPDLPELSFKKELYGDISEKVIQFQYNGVIDINKQLNFLENIVSRWNNLKYRSRYRGYDRDENLFMKQLAYLFDEHDEHNEQMVEDKMTKLKSESSYIKTELKKQQGVLSQIKSKREEMIRKLRDSGKGNTIKVITPITNCISIGILII